MNVPPLEVYRPLFPSKAEAMRYRKAVLLHVAELERDQQEIEAETLRIRESFGYREPAALGEDFLARFHRLHSAGTAARRKLRRENKERRRQQKAHHNAR